MYLIWGEGCEKAGVDLTRIKKTDKISTKMKGVQDGLGVKNMSDLVLKEIYGIYKTKNLTNKQT